MFNWSMKVPWGYKREMRTLAEVYDRLRPHYHPVYLRRLLAWLHSRGGKIGVGSHWRAGGAQPDLPGYAPEGRSFHQDQEWNDGFVGAAAVDLVVKQFLRDHRSPYWSEVPKQQSGHPDIARFGLHCNVEGEPWHIQPVIGDGTQVDGWSRWWNAGRPSPSPLWTPPLEHDPFPPAGRPRPDPQPDVKEVAVEVTLTEVKRGSRGADVRRAQALLLSMFGIDPKGVDGIFGPGTHAAVVEFQRKYGLSDDGIVGPRTWTKLLEAS